METRIPILAGGVAALLILAFALDSSESESPAAKPGSTQHALSQGKASVAAAASIDRDGSEPVVTRTVASSPEQPTRETAEQQRERWQNSAEQVQRQFLEAILSGDSGAIDAAQTQAESLARSTPR